MSHLLTSEVHSVRAGRHLASKLNVLVQQHFDLASTTITNIPMKVVLCISAGCTLLIHLSYTHFPQTHSIITGLDQSPGLISLKIKACFQTAVMYVIAAQIYFILHLSRA